MCSRDELATCTSPNSIGKRRGPRTTIKEGQLDVLNRTFGTLPKPSKHARAKLALETGLPMRVIQVWYQVYLLLFGIALLSNHYQNRRSKERRLKHLCNWIRERWLRTPLSPNSVATGTQTHFLK